MAQPSITVIDASLTLRTIFTINPNGQALAADSQPVVLPVSQAPLTDGQLRATPVPISGTVGISGTVPVSIAGTVTVTGPLTDTQLRATPVPVAEKAAETAGGVSAFTSTASATMQAANAARKGFSIQHEAGGRLYVLFGGGSASPTNYSFYLDVGDFYNMDLPIFTGAISAIFASAGTARVQELT